MIICDFLVSQAFARQEQLTDYSGCCYCLVTAILLFLSDDCIEIHPPPRALAFIPIFSILACLASVQAAEATQP